MLGTAKTQLTQAGDSVLTNSGQALHAAKSALESIGHLGRSAPGAIGGPVVEHSAELITTTARTREILAALIQSELDRAVGTLGLVPESEVVALRQSVERLERQVCDISARLEAAISAEAPA